MSFANLFAPPKWADKSISENIRMYFTKDLDYYIVPEGVEVIRSYAFYNFWPESGELKIKLPKSLKRIEPYAFSECALKKITIPSGVEEICDYAFYGAPLEDLVIEEGVKRIGAGAFMWGPNPPYIYIPDSVEYVGDHAFDGVSVPEGVIVEIGSGVKYIGNSAFACDVKSLVIHRNYGDIPDGSSGYFDDKGEWIDPSWYEGYPNPLAIWDGDW